jgi:hypothetical protein
MLLCSSTKLSSIAIVDPTNAAALALLHAFIWAQSQRSVFLLLLAIVRLSQLGCVAEDKFEVAVFPKYSSPKLARESIVDPSNAANISKSSIWA